jgi:hypothetical protein
MCRKTIEEVLQFSEQFLRSFVEIPQLDDFRKHILPSAAESSSRILQEVYRQMRNNGGSHTTPYHCRFVHLIFLASACRAERLTAAQKSFRTLRPLFAYCGCVDAGYVQYTTRACATTGSAGQPASRCVPHDEARAAQGRAKQLE